MVNVNGRETGLREPRRAYGGVVNNVSSLASCGRLRRSNQAYVLATKTSKEGDWRIVDGKIKTKAQRGNLKVEACRRTVIHHL